MTHKEMIQLAMLLSAEATPEIEKLHAQFPALMFKAMWLLELLPTVLEEAFHEADALNELNRRAMEGRALMASRFGVMDSYEFTSATAHLGELAA